MYIQLGHSHIGISYCVRINLKLLYALVSPVITNGTLLFVIESSLVKLLIYFLLKKCRMMMFLCTNVKPLYPYT